MTPIGPKGPKYDLKMIKNDIGTKIEFNRNRTGTLAWYHCTYSTGPSNKICLNSVLMFATLFSLNRLLKIILFVRSQNFPKN